jgi:flagellar biosynthesis/type III secretory pathway chaperone
MFRVCRIVLTLSLVLLLSSPVLAQQRQRGQRGQGQRGGFGGGGLGIAALLQNEGVQKELKLDEPQIGKIKEVVQKIQEKNQGTLAKLQDLPQEERRGKAQELNRAISNETLTALGDTLKPEQIKRLKQIELQAGGAQAFARAEVQQALNLTSDQKEKIKTINDGATAQMRDLFQGGNAQGAQEKLAALRKETLGKVQSVLTADQVKTWKDLTGDPFEVQFQRRRGAN